MKNYSTFSGKTERVKYDDFVKPLLYLEAQHQALEEKYAQDLAAASVLRQLIGDNNPEALQRYNLYNNAINEAVEGLNSRGIVDPQVKNSLLALKSNYATNIVPLQSAYTNFEAWKKERADTEAKSKLGYVYEKPTSQFRLDDFLQGRPTEGLRNVNKDTAYSMGVSIGKAFANRETTLNDSTVGGGQYWNFMRSVGYSSLQAAQKNPELNSMIVTALDNLGMGEGSNYSLRDIEEVTNAIMQGLNEGITFEQKDSFHQNLETAAMLKSGSKSGTSGSESIPTQLMTRSGVLVSPTTNKEIPFNKLISDAGLVFDRESMKLKANTENGGVSIWGEGEYDPSKKRNPKMLTLKEFLKKYNPSGENAPEGVNPPGPTGGYTPPGMAISPAYDISAKAPLTNTKVKDEYKSDRVKELTAEYNKQVEAAKKLYSSYGLDWEKDKETYIRNNDPKSQYKGRAVGILEPHVTKEFWKTGAAKTTAFNAKFSVQESKDILDYYAQLYDNNGKINAIREIKEIKDDGTIEFDSKDLDTSKFTGDELKDKMPTFFYVPNKGNGKENSLSNYILIKYGGKLYGMSLSKIDSGIASEIKDIVTDYNNVGNDFDKTYDEMLEKSSGDKKKALQHTMAYLKERYETIGQSIAGKVVSALADNYAGSTYKVLDKSKTAQQE